jgi:hypothetical protein
MKRSLQSLLLAVALSAAPGFAGTAIVGVATAVGSFSVNNSSVSGTANLSDGALLKTNGATSQVMLKGGFSALLGTNSAASFYSSKVVLVQGGVRFDNLKPGFSVDASSLRVENDQAGGQGAVRLNGNKVEVASIVGNMNVYNQQGVLLARVAAGNVAAVDDPQSGASSDQGQTGTNGKPCKSNKDPGCGGYTPPSSGAGGSPTMSNAAALGIAGGLAALGLGLGIGLSQQSSGTPASP